MFKYSKGKDKSDGERRVAICIFDDIAEQCQGAALKYVFTFPNNTRQFSDIYNNLTFYIFRYYPTYVPFLLDASNDGNPEVRQVRWSFDPVTDRFL